jgi:NAD(P)-dependent dehydrogenase (short-subunit alcohol dehydrogenase family)
MGSRSIAFIPAQPAPSARRACSPPAPLSWVVSPEEAERRDFAPDSPRGNAICRMVDASEVAFVAVFLASEKAWAISGELVVASGGAGRSVYY